MQCPAGSEVYPAVGAAHFHLAHLGLIIFRFTDSDAVSDLAQHFLDKIKCLVVKDVEREDIEFVCKTLHCRPIASLDHFTAENLSSADLVEEVASGTNKFVKITGIQNMGRTVSIICRGSNKLVLEEAARSLHDALCVVRCLVKLRAQIVGGGAPEIEMALQLATCNPCVLARFLCFLASCQAGTPTYIR